MTLSFAIKAGLILLFVGSILYVHLRGKARLAVAGSCPAPGPWSRSSSDMVDYSLAATSCRLI